MLNYEYPKPEDQKRPYRKGIVEPKNPHQLAGRRFSELLLNGSLLIRDASQIKHIQDWLYVAEGAIQVGGVRKSEPRGTTEVRYNMGKGELEIVATLLCADDCQKLGKQIELEMHKSGVVPAGAGQEPRPVRFIDPDAIPAELRNDGTPAGSYRGLGEALRQADSPSMLVDVNSLEHTQRSLALGRLFQGTPEPAQQQQIITLPTDIDQRPMVQHAAREMRLAGMYTDQMNYGAGTIAECVLDAIKVVSSQGHSGGSMEQFLLVFDKLVRRENLSPLTNDPAEWQDIDRLGGPADMRYQNVRNSKAFSADGGQTYWLLDENNPKDRVASNVSVKVETTGPHPVHG